MLKIIKQYFLEQKKKNNRQIYCEGRTISQFIARDVRRDVLVVSAQEIDDGFIVARIRTINLLYRAHGLVKPQPFGKPQRVNIKTLWQWSGELWGGLPDGTSIVDHLDTEE